MGVVRKLEKQSYDISISNSRGSNKVWEEKTGWIITFFCAHGSLLNLLLFS